MLIYLDIKIPHLQIAHLGGNLEVGNIEIHLLQEGHPLLDRDTFLNDIDGFVLPTNLGGDGGIACSGCVKPSDATPISPSSPLQPTNPFIKSSPCPHMFRRACN